MGKKLAKDIFRNKLGIFLITGMLFLAACGEPELPEVVIIATVPPLPQPAVAAEAVSEIAAEPAADVVAESVGGENGRFLTIWTDSMRAPALEMAADAFEAAHDDVKVIVQQVPLSDIRLNLLADIPSDAAPDIVVGPHTWIGELVHKNRLAPTNLGEISSQFVPVSLAAFTNDGLLYGMPISTDNIAFFINQDLVPDCPSSWSDVLTFSRTRAANNSEDVATNQYGFVRMEGNAYHFFPMQSAFGGYIFGPDDTIGLGGAGSVAAADYYATFLNEGLQPAAVTIDDMRVWFESGKSAMTIIGPWALESFRNADLNYKICDIPSESAAGQVLVEAQGLMLSSFSVEPELAQLFLTDFVATPDTMQAMADVDNRLSAYVPVRSNADPDMLAIGNVGAKGTPIPAVPEMAHVWEPWETAVTLISRQQALPVDAFSNATAQIRAVIAQSEGN